MQYCLYLRKSRADAEAEARGEGETLARHEKTLLELAKKLNLNITQIYREIVSGETIAARPVMQQLLSEVEQGVWAGVLVMEVERLARGDTIDQGIVAQTFKYSDTKIITPVKTYNPNDEFDEEYFEFGLFMSRREYKTINRRLQRGRIASVKEGRYLGSVTPYGYSKVRIKGDKGWTLEPVEEEAKVIRLIYELYTEGEEVNGVRTRLGVSKIANRLNQMKIPPKKGDVWVTPSIRDILINPVYCGKVRWNWRQTVKRMEDGEVRKSRPRNHAEDTIVVKGLHMPIVSEEIFNKAQELMSKNPPRPVGERNTVQNPLSGLVVCGFCGRRMVRRPYQQPGSTPTLMCPLSGCPNVSSDLELVEKRILEALSEWLENYKLNWNTDAPTPSSSAVALTKAAVDKAEEALKTLNGQLARTHDLLEQGIYDTDTFLLRSRELTERIGAAQKNLADLRKALGEAEAREVSQNEIIPRAEKLLELYPLLPTPAAKNDMLKEVLEKVVYTKSVRGKRNGPKDNFEIELFPKIPSSEE